LEWVVGEGGMGLPIRNESWGTKYLKKLNMNYKLTGLRKVIKGPGTKKKKFGLLRLKKRMRKKKKEN